MTAKVSALIAVAMGMFLLALWRIHRDAALEVIPSDQSVIIVTIDDPAYGPRPREYVGFPRHRAADKLEDETVKTRVHEARPTRKGRFGCATTK